MRWWGRALLLATLAGGCNATGPRGGEPADATRPAPEDAAVPAGCVPGRSAACVCPEGTRGAQICGDDRTWGRCACGALDAAVDDGGAGGAADAGDAGDAGADPPDVGRPPDCEEGAEEYRPCGLNGNGLESRACADGVWSRYGDCADPDECRNGTVDDEPCGVSGVRFRECAGGRWGGWGACDDPDRECDPEATETSPCGLNGRGAQARACEDGRWSEWSACDDPDECVDDAPHQRVCGHNERGFRGRFCAEGHWGEWSACHDPDECVDDTDEAGECGFNGNGVRTRHCDQGRWGEWSACDDPDECEDGTTMLDPAGCGLNGRGERLRSCDGGRWGEWAACDDPDECVDGGVEGRVCGLGGRGERHRVCEAGRWAPYGPCRGAPPCPEAGSPACDPPSVEVCNGLDDDGDGAVDEGLLALPGDADGPRVRDAFTDAVDAAVERGLEHLRRLEAGSGRFAGPGGDTRHNGLAVLAFLERRPAAAWGRPAGWTGLAPSDRERLRRALRASINAVPALTDAAAPADAYVVGTHLGALTVWRLTGGPDDVGALVRVDRAIANGVAALRRHQAEDGGWPTETPEPWGPLSLAHFAASGLAAAARFVPAADTAVRGVAPLLPNARNLDGGSGDWVGMGSGASATAAALWLHYLLGDGPTSEGPASALAWLAARHRPDGVADPFAPTSTWYGLWLVGRALGAMGAEDDARFARRRPADTPFPSARAGFYFDVAVTLLGWQDPSGAWGAGPGGGPAGWDALSSHLFALLTLERAFGGLTPDGADGRVVPGCADGVDGDGDGLVDAADPDCFFACTASERPVPACSNFIDDDGDGLVDAADPGCGGPLDDDETNPACSNGLDDDGDGLVDYPFDPGCVSPRDDDERDPPVPPVCANGRDDDGDGRIDFGQDPDCISAAHGTEGDGRGCPAGSAFEVLPADARQVRGSSAEAPNQIEATCGGQRGRERIYGLPIASPTRVRLSLVNDETTFDTVLYARVACTDAVSLACNDDAAPGEMRSATRFDALQPGLYFVVVDAKVGGGDFLLEIEREPLPVACSNGIDDDGDGRVDRADPGCADDGDRSEVDPVTPPECSNGIDDDGDGIIDFPAEPGCWGPGDPDERDPPVPAVCANGVDDDGDGLVDWPDDPGCAGRGADSEFPATPVPR